MSTLTKEWLQRTIAELEVERDSVPGAVNEDAAMALAAMKRALASLMAEPDYYVVVTSVGVWQSFCKTKAEAEFIVSKPFNPGYSILEIYTAPPAPVVPNGWVMVPIEPTEDMIVNGFESEPDESFSDAEVWEAYEAMSGCQQAAHRAKLCWAAMIAAAPQQEVKL